MERMIRRYFLKGPPENASGVELIIGMWLWWRTLSIIALYAVTLCIAVFLPSQVWVFSDRILIYVIGVIAGGWAIMLSPKYEVTKNW